MYVGSPCLAFYSDNSELLYALLLGSFTIEKSRDFQRQRNLRTNDGDIEFEPQFPVQKNLDQRSILLKPYAYLGMPQGLSNEL